MIPIVTKKIMAYSLYISGRVGLSMLKSGISGSLATSSLVLVNFLLSEVSFPVSSTARNTCQTQLAVTCFPAGISFFWAI